MLYLASIFLFGSDLAGAAQKTPQDMLCEASTIARINEALLRGADVNGKCRDSSYRTALHGYAEKGDLKLAEHLISKGAHVEGSNLGRHEPTPLCMAVIYGQDKMLSFLHRKGADIHAAETIKIPIAITGPTLRVLRFGTLWQKQ